MGQNVTKSNSAEQVLRLPPETPDLTGEQRRAIQLLLAGKTITDVAHTLQRDRKTIYRWKENPNFMSELNKQQSEMRERIQTRLHNLADKAVDVIEANLAQNNLRAALELLKIVSLNGQIPFIAKQTSPELILKEQAEKKAMAAVYSQPFAEKRNVNSTAQELAYELASEMKAKYNVQSILAEIMDEG